MSSAAPLPRLLERLDRPRQTGPGQWRAKCPAHEGKSRESLAITEGDDGRVLITCFGACPPDRIVAAVGLELRDLFPARDLPPDVRRDYARGKAIETTRRVLIHELLALLQILEAHRAGRPVVDPNPEERERLAVARIRRALDALYHA